MKNPTNLDECIEAIDNFKMSDLEQWIKKDENNALSAAHHGFGTFLRNEWGLWEKNDLTKWFKNQNIHHADDMSDIILTTYHRTKNKKDVLLNEQIQEHIEYWKQNK